MMTGQCFCGSVAFEFDQPKLLILTFATARDASTRLVLRLPQNCECAPTSFAGSAAKN